MSAVIYLEGGAKGPSSSGLSISCQQAFHKLLDRMGFTGRKPRLVACGGRQDVFDRFTTALRAGGFDYIAMWIDSEDPMSNIEQAWEHLASVTTVSQWERPANVTDEQVLFMTTCMETWIVADRSTLREHYKQGFQENGLPAVIDLESKQRHAVLEALLAATRSCRNPYAKGGHSYEIFEKLNPNALESLPSFARVNRILNKKLR